MTRGVISFLFIFIQCLVTNIISDNSLPSSSPVFPNHVILAFADYDWNREMDVFLLNTSTGLDIYVQTFETKEKVVLAVAHTIHVLRAMAFQPLQEQLRKNSVIVSAIPSDFNGDSLADLILLMAPQPIENSNYFEMLVSYRDPNRTDSHFYKLRKFASFSRPPLLVDYNADGITDVIGEDATTHETLVYMGTSNNTFVVSRIVDNTTVAWSKPGYAAFVDALSEFRPGVFLTLRNRRDLTNSFQYFQIQSDGMTLVKEIPLFRKDVLFMGAPVFADWNFNGQTSMMVPHCFDGACSDGGVLGLYDFQTEKWTEIPLNSEWGFSSTIKGAGTPLTRVLTLPPMMPMRGGDFTLNHWPDGLFIVQHKTMKLPSGWPVTAVALLRRNEAAGKYGLQILFNSSVAPPEVDKSAHLCDVAFFGHDDDGRRLNLWLTWCKGNESSSEFTVTHYAYYDEAAADAYFVNVMVLSGLSDKMVIKGQGLPYGLPIPGSSVYYSTDGENGETLQSRGHILTMVGYQSLQLPFHIFGLSSTANYIENLEVAMPTLDEELRKHDFPQIVPKTQLVIVPCPLDQPTLWTSKLFLEPLSNKRVYSVLYALLGAALVLGLATIILQCRENQEDNRDKVKDVIQFNFDVIR